MGSIAKQSKYLIEQREVKLVRNEILNPYNIVSLMQEVALQTSERETMIPTQQQNIHNLQSILLEDVLEKRLSEHVGVANQCFVKCEAQSIRGNHIPYTAWMARN